MSKEKTFKEQFPSLKDSLSCDAPDNIGCPERKGGIGRRAVSKKAVKEHCLDKQRVREVLDIITILKRLGL